MNTKKNVTTKKIYNGNKIYDDILHDKILHDNINLDDGFRAKFNILVVVIWVCKFAGHWVAARVQKSLGDSCNGVLVFYVKFLHRAGERTVVFEDNSKHWSSFRVVTDVYERADWHYGYGLF